MRDLSKLQEAVDWLRINPVPNLDMASWRVNDLSGCGTTHCIAGWLAENKKFGLTVAVNGTPQLVSNRNRIAYAALEQAFALTELEARPLFTPDSTGLHKDWEYVLNKLEWFINVGHYFIKGSDFQLLNSGFHHNINLKGMQGALRELPSEVGRLTTRLFEFTPTPSLVRFTQHFQGTAYFKIHRKRIYFVQGRAEFELEERDPEY